MTAWLTQILPDPTRRGVQRDLADAASLHRSVMRLVPDDLGPQARRSAGVLFRLDDDQRPRLLVQTSQRPELHRLPADYGAVATKPLAPLLDALETGMVVRYRLAANPSKRLGRHPETGKPGQIVPLYGIEAEQWWIGRAAHAGLALATVHTRALGHLTGHNAEGHRVKHTATRFDGVATVTVPSALRDAVLGGIGKGKAYGCGLLSLAAVGAADGDT